MNELISVVIPIYKVEKYLVDCIESVINQTYKNLEIILVDDGSPDLCPKICEEYKKKDKRIRIIHKKNGGLSDARNSGINIALGKYITFIDSDDFIDSEFIEYLYEILKANNADISFCSYKRIEENDKLIDILQKQQNQNKKVIKLTNIKCIKLNYIGNEPGMEFIACGKLYNIDLFKKNNIMYPFGKIHEDIFTTYKLYYFSKITVFTNAQYYYYRLRENSIMTQTYNVRQLDTLEATKESCVFFDMRNEKELLQYAFNNHLRETVKSYCKLMNFGNDAQIKQYKKAIEKQFRVDFKCFIHKIKMPLKKKIFYILFYVMPNKYFGKFLDL